MSDPRVTAVDVLRDHQQQLDMDGVMVGVSRQAIDEVLTELATLRAQNAALQTVASAAQIAAEELVYFVDFAVRQCEFEGDEVAGYAAVNAVRNALAQVAK